MSTTTTQNVHKPKKELNKSNNANDDAVSKTWNVTNNTDTDLLVIDAFLTDPNSTDELYQRSLQLLSSSDGKQVIQSGATHAITFIEAHTDNNGNAVNYTLIIARADNLFPVKIVELSVSGGQSTFPDSTIAASDAKLMKQAENFQQTIMAFPTSEMATAFAAVLTDPDELQIAGFFKAYPKYGAIKLDMVTAVQTYYNRFGFVWAGYTGNQSYSLYTSDGTKKKSLGSLSINNKAFASVTSLDAPTGFTTTYIDANHRKTVLYYSDGQFSDDANSSSPAICLQGLFILKSQLTGQDTDSTLIPVMYGVVNDNEVFGYTESGLPLSATSNKSGISALLDPQDVWGWLKLAGLIAGVIAAIAVLSITARFIIKATKKGLVLTPEEIRKINRQKAQDALSRMDPKLRRGLRIPDDLNEAVGGIKKQASENLMADSRLKMIDIIQKQHDTCQTLLEYGNTSPLQQALANITRDAETLEGNAVDLVDRMDGLVGNITANNKILSDRISSLGKKISEADTGTIADARKIADDLTKRVLINEEIRRDLGKDEIPEIIEE